MKNIKNCPFCPDGGDAQWSEKPESYGYSAREIWISCHKCGANRGKAFRCSEWQPGIGTYDTTKIAEEKAIFHWNERP